MRRGNAAGRKLNFSLVPRRSQTSSGGVAGDGFLPLFDVSIRHGYYNADDNGTVAPCGDFDIVPTPSCVETMQSFRMVFKNQGTGWTVYILDSMRPDLARYVADNAIVGPEGPEYWSRLTFLLVPRNPLFVGITELPIATSPLKQNFYLSNRTAHTTDAGTVLCEGEAVDAATLRSITGQEFTVTIPLDAQFIVRDIAGQAVVTVSAKEPQPPDSSNAVIAVKDGKKTILIDLGSNPYGFYTLECTDAPGHPIATSGFPEQVIYVPTRPQPLGLVDLLFTAPTSDSAGVYPLPRPDEANPDGANPDEAAPVAAYLLPFQARETYWYYYVVSQRPLSWLTDLRIDADGVGFTRDPAPVRLPTGDLAIRFRSDEALRLRRYPPQRFRLSGRRKGAGTASNPIEVYPLPAAPAQPVWPDETPDTCMSQIYVYV